MRNSGRSRQVIDKPIADYPKGTPFKTWVQSQGVTPQAQAYTPPRPPPRRSAAAALDVNIANTGLLYGTYTKTTGGINSSRQVPIRIYNNYVRWIWAYVQYLGTDKNGNDVNLSINPNAKLARHQVLPVAGDRAAGASQCWASRSGTRTPSTSR